MFFPTSHEAGSSSFLESPQPCRGLSFPEIQLATQDFDESLARDDSRLRIYATWDPRRSSPQPSNSSTLGKTT
ncbi:hypothetical protein Tco_0676441 [Tanacetum coccineum]